MKPMTTKEKFIDMCFQRLLSISTSTQIVERSIPIADRVLQHMKVGHKIDWNGTAEGYPESIYGIIWQMVIRKMALKWINKNTPEAFYKQLFL